MPQEPKTYKDGSPAVSFYYDGSAAAVYPDSGDIAVSVSVSRDASSVETLTYCYDQQSAMIACFDQNGVGYAYEGPPNSRKLTIGDTYFRLQSSTGEVLKQTQDTMNKGNTWSLPLTLKLTPHLTVILRARDNITVVFTSETVLHEFDIVHASTLSLFMKENDDKFRPDTAPLSQFNEEVPAFKSILKQPHNSTSDEIRKILGNLGTLTKKLGTFSSTMPLPSRAKTSTGFRGEGDMPTPRDKWSLADSTFLQAQGVNWDTATKKDLRRMVAMRNPTLARTQILKAASGKYALDQQPALHRNLIPVQKLPFVSSNRYDDVIHEHPGKIVAICCITDWDANSVHSEHMLQMVYGNLQKRKDERFVMYKFDVSESRFMIQRYNLRQFPSVLLYFNGRLVRAQHIGGKVYKVRTRPPKMLLVEESPFLQRRIEQHLKHKKCDWDLVMDSNSFRVICTDRTKYKIILIDLDMDIRHLKYIHSAFCGGVLPKPGTAGPFIVGFSKVRVRKGGSADPMEIAQATGQLPVHMRLPKPFSGQLLLKALNRAARFLPIQSLHHRGTTQEDFIQLLEGAFQVAKENQFLPDDFRFRLPASSRGRSR